MAKKSASDKLYLSVEPRTVLGKAVKRLRKNGILPANIFGKDYTSTAVTVPLADFQKAYNEAGETGVIYLKLDSEEVPVLIKSVQVHPVNDYILHIDFRKINLRQKIETQVPLEFIGESPAANEGAVILYQMDELTVEALPTNIPSAIEVNLETLTEIGQEVKVGDLPKSDDYEIVNDPELVIVSVTAHKEESVEPDTTSTIPETEEGAPAEGGEEGATAEAPADGGEETKSE